MSQWLQTLLILSAGGAVLGLLLLGLRVGFKSRLPSALYYYAWLLVLLRMALQLPGLIAAPAPTAQSDYAYELRDEGAADEQPPVRPSLPAEYTTAVRTESPTAEAGTPVTDEALRLPAETADSLSGERLLRALRSPALWLAVWAAGAAVYLLRYLSAYRRFCRTLRKTLLPPRAAEEELWQRLHGADKPRLCRSAAVTTPMLLGLREPLLVLPDRVWSEERLEHILRHELIHYERRDLAFKWFGMAVFALHWFNPFTALFRRELDRVCELSCDERMLRGMDRAQKQDYGEMLLSLAADRSLPRGVVATAFATEKRTLKERLEQIMTYKRIRKTGIAAAALVLALLVGCGLALGPRAAEETASEPLTASTLAAELTPAPLPVSVTPQPSSPETKEASVAMSREPVGGEVTVTNVEELLAALASDTTVHLAAGEYCLSEAENYGQTLESGWYRWQEVADGYELQLLDIENLRLCGPTEGEAIICTEPRYADVLYFEGGGAFALSDLTVGHTVEPGVCAGSGSRCWGKSQCRTRSSM